MDDRIPEMLMDIIEAKGRERDERWPYYEALGSGKMKNEILKAAKARSRNDSRTIAQKTGG